MSSKRAHPFAEPSADIIICSSDDVHFKLHKLILSLASAFFRDMFSLPQPTLPASHAPLGASDSGPLESEGLPVIHVTEDSTVLDSLFLLCYPIDDPPLESLAQVRPTLEAAIKYQLEEAIKITKRKLVKLARSSPLSVYAVACRLSLESIAASAAQEAIRQKAQDMYVAELEEIPAGAYYRLLRFSALGGKAPPGFMFHRAVFGQSSPPVPRSDPHATVPESSNTQDEYAARLESPACDSAEVVVLASDEVGIRVARSVLQMSSPILSTMLAALPLADPTPLPLPEPSTVLSVLFQISSPSGNPSLPDLSAIDPILVAAEKYKMEKAISFLRGAFMQHALETSMDPVVLYLASCRLGIRPLANMAAQQTLRRQIVEKPCPDIDNFGVAAGALWRLLDYHRRSRSAVRAVVDDDKWMSEEWRNRLKGLCAKRSDVPCWHYEYMATLVKDPWPSSTLATSQSVLYTAVESQHGTYSGMCAPCGSKGIILYIKFSQYVQETMAAREKEVTLDFKAHPGFSAS